MVVEVVGQLRLRAVMNRAKGGGCRPSPPPLRGGVRSQPPCGGSLVTRSADGLTQIHGTHFEHAFLLRHGNLGKIGSASTRTPLPRQGTAGVVPEERRLLLVQAQWVIHFDANTVVLHVLHERVAVNGRHTHNILVEGVPSVAQRAAHEAVQDFAFD